LGQLYGASTSDLENSCYYNSRCASSMIYSCAANSSAVGSGLTLDVV